MNLYCWVSIEIMNLLIAFFFLFFLTVVYRHTQIAKSCDTTYR